MFLRSCPSTKYRPIIIITEVTVRPPGWYGNVSCMSANSKQLFLAWGGNTLPPHFSCDVRRDGLIAWVPTPIQGLGAPLSSEFHELIRNSVYDGMVKQHEFLPPILGSGGPLPPSSLYITSRFRLHNVHGHSCLMVMGPTVMHTSPVV